MTQHAELATMAVMIRDGVLLLAPVYHKQNYAFLIAKLRN